MDSAEKSFALFGYKATTMEQVARLANVGKGTIYTFFENKEELFDEILRSIIADMKQITEQTVNEENSFWITYIRVWTLCWNIGRSMSC